jgi:O-Antigen ligase
LLRRANHEEAAGERGMRLMLASVIVFLAVSEGLNWQLSLGYGLSVKNGLLYLIALALVMKFAVQQNFAFEVREIYVAFGVLISYAILSMLVVAFVVDYSRYHPIEAGIAVKNRLIDCALFFLVFFYALRRRTNVHLMIRFLLLAAVFANSLAVLDALGFVDIGDMEQRDDGRVEGVTGESNQYGAYVAMLLPGLLGCAVTTSGLRRLFWLGGVFVSSIALLLTVSRGAYVAIVVSAVWTAALLRPYISFGAIVRWAAAAFGLLMVLLIIVSARYGELLSHRLSTGIGGDADTMSSGRTGIWMYAITRMLEVPITFVTGYGWHVYEAMPFKHNTHNYYLWLWFNMGVVGVTCGVLLLAFVVRRARDAVAYLRPEDRPVLIAFVMGTLALAVATFFVDLYSPWIWFWAYAGLAMRLTIIAQQEAYAQQPVRPLPRVAQAPSKRDPFGWVGSARS